MLSGKRGEVCPLRRPAGTGPGADAVVVAVVAAIVAAVVVAVAVAVAVAIERAGGGGIRASRRRVHKMMCGECKHLRRGVTRVTVTVTGSEYRKFLAGSW